MRTTSNKLQSKSIFDYMNGQKQKEEQNENE